MLDSSVEANSTTHKTAQNRMVYIQNLGTYLTPACFSHALITNHRNSLTRQYRLEHADRTSFSWFFNDWDLVGASSAAVQKDVAIVFLQSDSGEDYITVDGNEGDRYVSPSSP